MSAQISFDQYGFTEMMDVLITASDTKAHKPEPEPLWVTSTVYPLVYRFLGERGASLL